MTKRSAPTDVTETDDELEFDEDFLELVAGAGMTWTFTKVRDWIILDPELRGTPLHVYALLRSLLFEKGGNRLLRALTVDQICFLLPGVNGGKPTGETAVKDALRVLDRRGLVTSPRGPVATSRGRGKIRTTRRLQVNDIPPLPFDGWINSYDKLKDYRPDWRTRPVTPPRYIAEQAPADPAVTGCNCGCHPAQAAAGADSAGSRPDDEAPATRPAAVAGSLKDQADAVAAAWVAARTARGMSIPKLGPDAIRRSAAALLRQRVDPDLLCAAAADLGSRGWTDLRKHLERWTPPVPTPRTDPSGSSAADALECPWCDPWGWYETTSGVEARCQHPGDVPANHPRAAKTARPAPV